MSRTPVTPSAESDLVATVRVQLPNPPARTQRLERGDSRLRAQQAAERAVATKALDAPGIEATTGDLPYEALRDTQMAVELAAVAVERIETDATGRTLVEDTRRGRRSPVGEDPGTLSLDGLDGELRTAVERSTAAREEHGRATGVLAGTELAPDGTTRPGHSIAPEARSPRHIMRALRNTRVLEAVPVVIPLVVEGLAVAFNMHSYLRAPEWNWIQPSVIAVITVGILTFAPYLLGVVLNDLIHGQAASVLRTVAAGIAACFWIGVGVTLALVRVQVDRAEAIRVAESRRRQEILDAQQLGDVTDIPPIDPDSVFAPTLPTIFWILVFVGFGVVLVLWEVVHRNPARAHELRLRLALVRSEERVGLLREHLSRLAGAVSLQREINDLALQMWDAERDVVRASAELDIAEYHRSLGEAAGDPDVPVAIERHKMARAVRRGQGGEA